MDKKLKAEKQLKRALAVLDTAVQNWYDVNASENKEHYAACHIRNIFEETGTRHVSNITVCTGPDDFVTIASSKERG